MRLLRVVGTVFLCHVALGGLAEAWAGASLSIDRASLTVQETLLGAATSVVSGPLPLTVPFPANCPGAGQVSLSNVNDGILVQFSGALSGFRCAFSWWVADELGSGPVEI